MKAEVKFSCGRHFLEVDGLVLIMEGDPCRNGDMPEEVYEPISEYELEHATIGGKSIKGMPPKAVRFFRGSNWTQRGLEYAAAFINGPSK